MKVRPARVLTVDPIACDGSGVCAELFPEWIRLDSWGFPVVFTQAVPDDALGHARWAVANCPTRALRLAEVQQPAGAELHSRHDP